MKNKRRTILPEYQVSIVTMQGSPQGGSIIQVTPSKQEQVRWYFQTRRENME